MADETAWLIEQADPQRPDLLPKTPQAKIGRVVEEFGEVIVAVGKLMRFGKSATDPKTGIEYDNAGALADEVLDLRDALASLARLT